MPKIVKNGLEYSGTPLEEVTAWPPTGDSVQIEQPLMGNTDISEVGDGTVTGAISELNNGFTDLFEIVNVNFNESTITANSAFAVSKTISVPSGYRAVGVINYDVARLNGISVTRIAARGTTFTVGGYNSSAITTLNGNADILCVKN